jgi:hypothetical protein
VANYRVSTKYKKQTIIQLTIQNTHTENKTRKKENDQTRLFKLKYELLKIFPNLPSEFGAETRLAVGQWLE